MTKEKIEKILSKDPEGRGIGVRNVNSRLKKYYGRGLKITSQPGIGTTVGISIPKFIRKGEKYDKGYAY